VHQKVRTDLQGGMVLHFLKKKLSTEIRNIRVVRTRLGGAPLFYKIEYKYYFLFVPYNNLI